MTYVLVRHGDAEEFLARAEPWLLSREAEHNLHLSLAYARREKGDAEPDCLFGTVECDGEVVGGVMRTPPHKLLLTGMPTDAAPVVAEAAADLYDAIPAVLGPADAAEAVATAWVAVRGGSWHPGMRQRIYRLDEVVPARPVSGELRLATMDDSDLLEEWGQGFGRDVGHAFYLEADRITNMIDRGHLYIWQDGDPVSMTVAQGATPNGCRIGYVYTPPELRGRGYASATVAEVSQRMLDSGMRFCVLYTDLSNPTSNAIYQKIGYNPIVDVTDVELATPVST